MSASIPRTSRISDGFMLFNTWVTFNSDIEESESLKSIVFFTIPVNIPTKAKVYDLPGCLVSNFCANGQSEILKEDISISALKNHLSHKKRENGNQTKNRLVRTYIQGTYIPLWGAGIRG